MHVRFYIQKHGLADKRMARHARRHTCTQAYMHTFCGGVQRKQKVSLGSCIDSPVAPGSGIQVRLQRLALVVSARAARIREHGSLALSHTRPWTGRVTRLQMDRARKRPASTLSTLSEHHYTCRNQGTLRRKKCVSMASSVCLSLLCFASP